MTQKSESPKNSALPSLPSAKGQVPIRSAPTPDIFFTDEELKSRQGKGDADTPEHSIYIGVAGTVYDVTKGRMFYGPGGPYSPFAGRDATIGLATFNLSRMRNTPGKVYKPLQQKHLKNIDHWKKLFTEKYMKVGHCAFDKEIAELIKSSKESEGIEDIVKKEKSKFCTIL